MIHQFVFLLEIVAPVFLVMVIGYGLRKARILSPESDRSLTRLVIVILAPALVLDTIIGNEALTRPANWVLPPTLGFVSILLGILCARCGARMLGVPAGSTRRAFVFTSSIQNYSYIPLPVCAALFPRETMGVLFAFCLGVEIAFWSAALWQLTESGGGGRWRAMINPLTIAIPTALVLNSLSAKTWLPATAQTTIHMLSACAIPIALLLGGALVADYFSPGSLRHGARTILAASAVRIVAVPALLMLLARFLPLDEKLRQVLVLQAAVPAAIFPLVVTRAYDGDVPTALRVILGTSLIGLATIPLWLGVGLRWILPH